MQNPTPAGLAKFVINRSAGSLPIPLYTPEDATAAYVLFPYGGGDAAAYTALVSEFRKRNASVALLFVPWGCDYSDVADRLRAYSLPLYFYSHCAGEVIAMKLLDQVNSVKKYIAGASVPPEEMQNIWPSVPNEMLMSVLYDAGMPKSPKSQEDSMLRQFRENTDEYFCYFSEKNGKTPTDVTLIFSTEDIFTHSHPRAAELWNRYIEGVRAIHYIDSKTHYFQSTQASELADILLKEVQ
jgi:surfactin synthase thioesterase subunit